ncbi:MAG: universal stress protein [Rubellimicrobium sp.]|nr:universal stress protein [Rubellimicrobium sp.]
MYDNILVPLALATEDDSVRPLEAVAKLASPGAKITFIHVVEDIPPTVAGYLPGDYIATIHKDRLAELARRVGEVKGAKVEVVEGNAATRILDRAEKLGIDCVVIASHRPGLRDWFLGSTAARVVRHAQCSVLVLR